MAHQAPVGQNPLTVEASRSHSSNTPHSVGLLWTSDCPTQRLLPDNTQHLQETDVYVPPGFEAAIPANEHAADPRLSPHGHTKNINQICLKRECRVVI